MRRLSTRSQGQPVPESELARETPAIIPPPPLTPKQARTTPEDNGRGQSADKTLGWDWKVAPRGARTLRVFLWRGGRYAEVIHKVDPAP